MIRRRAGLCSFLCKFIGFYSTWELGPPSETLHLASWTKPGLPGPLAELGKVLGELWGLEEPSRGFWDILYIEKLPINRTRGRYVSLEYILKYFWVIPKLGKK